MLYYYTSNSMSLLKRNFLKKLLILLVFFYATNVYANSHNKILEGILNSVIPGGGVKLSSSNKQYITGENLKNFLFSNEITIKTEDGKTHAYQFNSNMTYEVFSYPQRNSLGSGSWKIYPGFVVDQTYTVPDHIYLRGFRSGLRDPYFIFVSNPKIIKVAGNIQNPNDYVVAQIVSVLPKAKVKQIIEQRIAKERAEQERLAKIKAEQDRIEQERIAKERAEQERLAKIRAEQERIQAEKDRKERERLEKIKAEQERNQTIINTLIVLAIAIAIYFIFKKRAEAQRLAKLKKDEEHQKFLSENLGQRLIEESSNIIKSKGDIVSWDEKNAQFLDTVKKYLIKNLNQTNKGLISSFEKLSREIKILNKDIETEKETYKNLYKKYPFIKTIINARGEN